MVPKKEVAQSYCPYPNVLHAVPAGQTFPVRGQVIDIAEIYNSNETRPTLVEVGVDGVELAVHLWLVAVHPIRQYSGPFLAQETPSIYHVPQLLLSIIILNLALQ